MHRLVWRVAPTRYRGLRACVRGVRFTGQGRARGGDKFLLRTLLVDAVGMESGQKVGMSTGSGQECVAGSALRERCGTRSGGMPPCQLAGSRFGTEVGAGAGAVVGSWAVSGKCSSRSQGCLTSLIISLPPGPGLPEVPGMLMSSSTSCQSVVSWIAAITSSAQLTSFTLKSSLPPKRLLAAAKSASKASRWNCSSSASSTLRTPAVPLGSPFDDDGAPGIDRAGPRVRASSTKSPTGAADGPAGSG